VLTGGDAPNWGIPQISHRDESLVTSATETKRTAASFAPAAIAIISIIVGFFVPFIGLPLAMVAVVAISAANIEDRRQLYITIGSVGIAIAINLALVMMALPAGRDFVQGS
jgi:hypothetical protein